MAAEKTAKNFRHLLFCRTLYMPNHLCLWSLAKKTWISERKYCHCDSITL